MDEAETIQDHVFVKQAFTGKLEEMKCHDHDVVDRIMGELPDPFNFSELREVVRAHLEETQCEFPAEKFIKALVWLANSHYDVTFSLDTAIGERVIFPIASTESNGIEDARFVRFTEDDGSVRYYATYTAYNGVAILPMLLETDDFYHFKVSPMLGKNARSKGMALFPRKINGRYATLSRPDGENSYIMFSDIINLWEEPAQLLQEPAFPWEFVQLGNSGSPIETAHGWLLLTHGVGSMRRYCLGAAMLDRDDPTQVIGRIAEPILMANEKEREGYVPNVVYSCGSIIHHHELIIPYAMSDYSSGFVSIPLAELFDQLVATDHRPPSAATQGDDNI